MALTEAEYEYICEVAAAAGEPVAVYCRHVVLRNPPLIVPPVNDRIWSEMGVPLGNLNQLLRLWHLSRHEEVEVPDSLFALLQEEVISLRELRASLKGERDRDVLEVSIAAPETVEEMAS